MNNNIGDEGVKKLATAMSVERLPKLKELNVMHNNIGNVGIQFLADTLDTLGTNDLLTLESLYISGNNYDESTEATIVEICERYEIYGEWTYHH